MSEYGCSKKAIEEPDAGDSLVRFDEGAVETGVSASGHTPHHRSTLPSSLWTWTAVSKRISRRGEQKCKVKGGRNRLM